MKEENVKTLKERFWKKVKSGKPNECWEWFGVIQKQGYGQLWDGMKNRRANRVSWEIHNGKIPYGLCVLHKCDNPPCVNPNHLFIGTRDDNAKDAAKKGRSHLMGSKKLTPEVVLEIRKRYMQTDVSQADLAEEFNLHQTNIHYIIKRRTWKHI